MRFPDGVIQAFLAAEDKNFYSHPGVDPLSIVRAVFTNLERLRDDRRPVGASTITQQVAKNFLLSNEVTFERKIKEAMLALRIEQAFTKDEILELYLNQIYLGVGSYGVAAAALNYFDKSLDELTSAKPRSSRACRRRRRGTIRSAGRSRPGAARLGDRAHARRRLHRPGAGRAGVAEPLVMRGRAPTEVVTAEYFVEEVRRELIERHGEDFLYQGGLSILTTVSPTLQAIAKKALRDGLVAYDRRHGWRGPKAQTDLPADPGVAVASRRDQWRGRPRRLAAGPGHGGGSRCGHDRSDRRQHGAAAVGRAAVGSPGRRGG